MSAPGTDRTRRLRGSRGLPAVAIGGSSGRATMRRARGMSLIELMVGMVVALLVGLAATGSASVFTASQRQGIGAGGTAVGATTALNAIRDDVAAAGLGFFGDSRYLCERLNFSVAAAVITDGSTFTPLLVSAEAATDRVDVIYATDVSSGANVLLDGASTGTTARLMSLLPVSAGQSVLLAPVTPGDPCLVRSVTAVADSTIDTPQTLTFASTGANNQAAFTTSVTYADRARIALLGALHWSRYRREGTDLRLERPLGGAPVVLARNVIAFRAQYGLAAATAGSTALESWQNASGGFAALSAATLPRVRALRLGVITRSPQAEKPNPQSGQCEASSSKPKDPFDTAVEVTPDVSDWQCYRYRTAIVVVPLRNLVLGVATP